MEGRETSMKVKTMRRAIRAILVLAKYQVLVESIIVPGYSEINSCVVLSSGMEQIYLLHSK